jgi:hypothetical protein
MVEKAAMLARTPTDNTTMATRSSTRVMPRLARDFVEKRETSLFILRPLGDATCASMALRCNYFARFIVMKIKRTRDINIITKIRTDPFLPSINDANAFPRAVMCVIKSP